MLNNYGPQTDTRRMINHLPKRAEFAALVKVTLSLLQTATAALPAKVGGQQLPSLAPLVQDGLAGGREHRDARHRRRTA